MRTREKSSGKAPEFFDVLPNTKFTNMYEHTPGPTGRLFCDKMNWIPKSRKFNNVFQYK